MENSEQKKSSFKREPTREEMIKSLGMLVELLGMRKAQFELVENLRCSKKAPEEMNEAELRSEWAAATAMFGMYENLISRASREYTTYVAESIGVKNPQGE